LIIDNGGELRDDDVRFWRVDGALDEVGEVFVLRMPTNLGVASSWNLGIKALPFAEGWLFLNSDAYFAPGAFDEFADQCSHDRVTQAGNQLWCCTHIGRDAINDVGLFCERFHPAYMEDVDWERRARIIGVDFVASKADVRHDNSSTIRSDATLGDANGETHARNFDYFKERWTRTDDRGLPVDAEWSLETRMVNAWER
jgi:GT2 family glycosyltransferase